MFVGAGGWLSVLISALFHAAFHAVMEQGPRPQQGLHGAGGLGQHQQGQLHFREHLPSVGYKKKANRTLLEFLELFNKAGFLARRHSSKDSRIHQYLQDRAMGCLRWAFVPCHPAEAGSGLPDGCLTQSSNAVSLPRPRFCYT